MSVKVNSKRNVRMRKKKHIRKKVFGTADCPRLVVFRSLKHIYAQLVDDTAEKTLLTVSSLSKDLKEPMAEAKTKTDVAKIVGLNVAERAKKNKIEKVVFDRSGYIYHGRVKALAEGAREGGLKF